MLTEDVFRRDIEMLAYLNSLKVRDCDFLLWMLRTNEGGRKFYTGSCRISLVSELAKLGCLQSLKWLVSESGCGVDLTAYGDYPRVVAAANDHHDVVSWFVGENDKMCQVP